ncbi:YcnI family copper-binding membrane protein [Actinomadura rudentiformis]|uniref:YcnI family protein n=1 Tax=Actinomadura rudentiformis TaxID=359158 RepID=A0A6H9Z7G8_9ACTN|nr:YcnI family protein [Actinomadura rudentiformis]KAB2350938.1 YcnI family protein [Actinomadura rudentiformis]
MSISLHARRGAAVTGLALVSVLGLATAASAHVTVNPREAEQDGYVKVAFRVPNERDNAGTTKVQVDLPMDHPLASVSVRPVPGWKIKVEKSKLKTPIKAHGGELTEAVSRITWSGGKIEPGQFQEFDVSMGRMPTDTDRLIFKAEQTYSGGEVVKWDQVPKDGQEEPEHPAPILKLTPKGATATGAGASGAPTVKTVAAGTTSENADDGTARLLGGLGLATGLIGIAIGGYGISRARSRS